MEPVQESSKSIQLLSELVCNNPTATSTSRGVGIRTTPAPSPRLAELTAVLRQQDLHELKALAASNHVLVRAFDSLGPILDVEGNRQAAEWVHVAAEEERSRIQHALGFLSEICNALQQSGCPVTVIKSLDHWPDLGSDLDLYSDAEPERVVQVMTSAFHAQVDTPSWGDRLANKWNFVVPGLPELVEIHVGRLGQTGEQIAVTRSVSARTRSTTLGHYGFNVPAPEDRIVISTLQRMYRHFYIRLCDILNISNLLRSNAIDFPELKTTADMGAIWPGVATLMLIVCDYVKSYGGEEIDLPREVVSAARFSGDRTYISEKFLRIPIVPEAAGLYTNQMLGIGAHRNFRAMLRLSLLPALATAAFVGYKLTGSDKGIW